MPLPGRSARTNGSGLGPPPSRRSDSVSREDAKPSSAAGRIHIGIGGWTFEPWRGSFYPKGLPQVQELAYASRCVTTIEINGTFYRTQTPKTFAKWAREVPDNFVFSVKAPRAVTMRRVLGETGEGIERFMASGVAELGEKLGPILWQLAPTHKYEPDDLARFLDLLPDELRGRTMSHALEVRHPSFATPEFIAQLRARNVAVVYAEHATYPEIADLTSDFVYARLQKGRDEIPTAYPQTALEAWARRLQMWAEGETPADLPLADRMTAAPRRTRDVFAYLIHEGKVRAPAAAEALISRL